MAVIEITQCWRRAVWRDISLICMNQHS